MAYVVSAADAADGRGTLSLHGHELASEVVILTEDDSRGDIEIRWEHGIGLGLRACLEIAEVWTLITQLATAVAVFNGEPGTDPVCRECGSRIELLDNGIDRWWVHDVHPADGHDGWPAMPRVEQSVDVDGAAPLPDWIDHGYGYQSAPRQITASFNGVEVAGPEGVA
ncbi:hypothetical protein [Nocardia sp. NBC_01327]|uniref:hypothetical protein n=1 Tax=Nocardia sp. NBC_01327 TaxID=2903593 RepID=UPI002E0E0842|nr:hypothetical protein OG326_34660 [Nocardia sp. NBC_01327]